MRRPIPCLNPAIPCYKYSTCCSESENAFVLMKVRSSGHVKPLSSHGIGPETLCPGPTVSETRQDSAKTCCHRCIRRRVRIRSNPTFLRMATPVLLGTTVNQVMAKHKSKVGKGAYPDDSTSRSGALAEVQKRSKVNLTPATVSP